MKRLPIILTVLLLASCQKEVNQSIESKQVSNQILPYVPKPDHVVIVILENKRYNQVIGNSDAPYLNSLKRDTLSANFTKSNGVTHPSQPNYLCLFSGSNQGNTDDDYPNGVPFTTPNLARQLIDAGYSFATYCEDLPYEGYNGESYADYDRKHNPVMNWIGTGENQVSGELSKPFTEFPITAKGFAGLPTVSFVIPNENHNMHDGSISEGDTWLKQNLAKYRNYCKTRNSLLIITFDEAVNDGGDNHIATIFLGKQVKNGNFGQTINHYNILRTIEDMYSLPYAGNAANVSTISNCWR